MTYYYYKWKFSDSEFSNMRPAQQFKEALNMPLLYIYLYVTLL